MYADGMGVVAIFSRSEMALCSSRIVVVMAVDVVGEMMARRLRSAR